MKMQNKTASHFMPIPRSKAYMGPPSILPCGVRMRYLTASSPSAYLVEMPNTPVSQHQNTAPGPPNVMAVATPTIFPVPMVAANAVANAPNWLTSPCPDLSDCTESRMALNSLRCGKRSRTVKNKWVPNRIITMGHPQSQSLHDLMSALSVSAIWVIFSRWSVYLPAIRILSYGFRGRYVQSLSLRPNRRAP